MQQGRSNSEVNIQNKGAAHKILAPDKKQFVDLFKSQCNVKIRRGVQLIHDAFMTKVKAEVRYFIRFLFELWTPFLRHGENKKVRVGLQRILRYLNIVQSRNVECDYANEANTDQMPIEVELKLSSGNMTVVNGGRQL